MSHQERFQTYYDQLKTELTTTYGTHFPPLDHSNPDHRETLKDCASQRITLGQKNFFIAWRQVLDKTGWTLEEQKDIANKLSANGYGINANPNILTSYSIDPMNLLVCSIWFWKRHDEVEKILDEEDRQAIKDKIKGIDSLSNSLVAPEARLVAREKLEHELEEFEGEIKERKQKNASVEKLFVDRRAQHEKEELDEYYEKCKKEAEDEEKARKAEEKEKEKEVSISQTPPPPPPSNEPDDYDQMTTQQLMDSHNANLDPGDLKVNLTQFEKLMEFVRFIETMSDSPEQSEAGKLAIEYIILHYQYYRSLLTTYPNHTVEFKCPYHNTKINFDPTEITILNGTCTETYLPDNSSLTNFREYLESKFDNQANRQRAFDSIGRGWAGPEPIQKHHFEMYD